MSEQPSATHPDEIREPVALGITSGDADGRTVDNPWLAADLALDAIPNGWAKVDGAWVELVQHDEWCPRGSGHYRSDDERGDDGPWPCGSKAFPVYREVD